MYKNIFKSLKKSEEVKPKPKSSGVKINPAHGKAIADAYEQMEHNPSHPDTQAAYGALISETKKQFADISRSGLQISRIENGQDNPYNNSKELHHDVKKQQPPTLLPYRSGFWFRW